MHSHPQRIISGLKETFIREIYIYIVERANKAEIRPEEQSEKAESCRKNLCNFSQKNNKNALLKPQTVYTPKGCAESRKGV